MHFFQSEDSFEIKLRTPLFSYSMLLLRVKVSIHVFHHILPCLLSGHSHALIGSWWRLTGKLRGGFATTWLKNMPMLFLLLKSLPSFQAERLLIKLFIPCLKTETGNFQIGGGSFSHKHWRGPDSILGQILDSTQMSITSTEGLEQVFLYKTNKSNILCMSS